MAGEIQKKVSVVSQPECSICYNAFDNVFRTPKLLECTHTFCLECLSRLMAVSVADHDSNGDITHVSCPFCRHLTTLPREGPPALATSREVLCKLPRHHSRQGTNMGAPESPSAFCICIDIGANKNMVAPVLRQPRTFGLLGRISDWKRMMLFIVLLNPSHPLRNPLHNIPAKKRFHSAGDVA
uniref:RING-type domain-containing protein n=1 Tax=Monopterus albus TaxID=43700 RepID=A0A3Q3QDL1_MONAL